MIVTNVTLVILKPYLCGIEIENNKNIITMKRVIVALSAALSLSAAVAQQTTKTPVAEQTQQTRTLIERNKSLSRR